MKSSSKIALVLFANLILIFCIVLCLMIFGWLDPVLVTGFLEYLTAMPTVSNITLVVSILLMLLAIKCIFFDNYDKNNMESKSGILLANQDGKLLISKETLENLIINVVKGFEAAQNAQTKVIFDKENNIIVYLTLFVEPNTVIKELSLNLQNRIKEEVKKASDLEVKEVNITVRDIAPVEEKKIQE